MAAKKKRLGRGLDGLLPAAPPKSEPKGTGSARIEELHPNRDQPRRRFDDAALDELAASIAEHGVLEPILVRKRVSGGGFEIIAGERRWRAAQWAGVKEVPIFVRELGDAAAFEAALVENLQREDLNPLETARAFQRLIDEFGHTQEEVATKVGKDRSTVANSLRLLKLPDEVLDLIEDGKLAEGHGRALLTAPDVPTMVKLGREASAKKLSVREVERRARGTSGGGSKGAKKAGPPEKSANVRDLERRLSHTLGAPVRIEQGKGEKGVVAIEYADFDQLDALLAKLGVGG
ncbi:MAG TPA: ParB/RepB/Spo0J family partition protein [Polyangiaceae bacterium LLY-WYZ-15_(1-7)]|nr:ParB/RepB/Spo0J family partition protein [Polyangiaceae bacterium LLY-WYZ-15_(1-7)]